MNEEKENEEMKNDGPVFEKRLNHIRVSVWRNVTDGRPWYNAVFTRRFKDGNEWRDSNAFNGLADLALLHEALDLARNYIRREEERVGSLAPDEAE
jgi:hypothetical protein